MESTTKTHLDHQTIQNIIKKHFGEVCVQNVTELTEGMFNAIYAVDYVKDNNLYSVVLKTGVEANKYVLSYEKDMLRAELQVYDLLKDTIIPTAEIYVRDFSREIINCDYFIMERLTGDNWGKLKGEITPENHDVLVAELAQYTAALHNVKGEWFGYIKDDVFYHHTTWKSAFQGMIQMMIHDGKEQGLDLPYDEFWQSFEPYWYLLDDIKEPCLVNFDMWTKNIMLKKAEDRLYHIDAIIDLERAFFGDPYADFLSSNTIVGDVGTCELFMKNYSKISGKDFIYTARDRVRLTMYLMYIVIMMGVEDYRRIGEDVKAAVLERCRRDMKMFAEKLKTEASALVSE